MNIVHHDFNKPTAIFDVLEGLVGDDESVIVAKGVAKGQGTEGVRIVDYSGRKRLERPRHFHRRRRPATGMA